MVTALPMRERERWQLDWLDHCCKHQGMGTLYRHLISNFAGRWLSLARERGRWQLDWLDHCCKHQGMGTLYRHLIFDFCRKMVTALPERERERGDNWTDRITAVNTKGWALFIVIFYSIFAGRWWQPCQREREREVTTGLIGSLL